MLDLSRIHVLVIDDNYHMTHLIKQVLIGLRVGRVTSISDATAGISRLKVGDIDIVIVDWMMTPLDGIEFLRIIRTAKDSPDPFVPIIMLTGHAEISRVAEARDAGVDEFVIKPFSAKALYLRLESVILSRRPFVRTSHYFGPSRRRQQTELGKRPDRRKKGPLPVATRAPTPITTAAPAITNQNEPQALSQQELAQLLKPKANEPQK